MTSGRSRRARTHAQIPQKNADTQAHTHTQYLLSYIRKLFKLPSTHSSKDAKHVIKISHKMAVNHRSLSDGSIQLLADTGRRSIEDNPRKDVHLMTKLMSESLV